MIDCNADLDHPCDADDGNPCPRCLEEQAYWKAEYSKASPQEKDPKKYERDMVDAGRGHLLRR